MQWPEAEIDELIENVRRDFALEKANQKLWAKLKARGISLNLAEKVISKKSYIIEYDHNGRMIGFFDSRNYLFVAWKPDYPSEIKTCFIADGGLDYLKRQYAVQFIWIPRRFMKTSLERKIDKSQLTPKQRASSLLEWLTKFLPTAIPDSAEQAILDTSGDIHALLWHRSELENILQKTSSALTTSQRKNLATLDAQMRHSALLIVGSEKGHLRRYREGRYDRSHWWWYLDDMLQEEAIVKSQKAIKSAYRIPEEGERLHKVADRRAAYGRKHKNQKG